MVNHLRTLLLNSSAASLNTDCDWAQYVDPAFRPVSLSPAMRSTWRILFGSGPDSWSLNWSAARYLNILHLSELSSFVGYYDSRLSYQAPVLLDDSLPLALLTPLDGASSPQLTGVPAEHSDGKAYNDFEVLLVGGVVTVQDLIRGTSTSVPAGAAGDWSAPIAVARSGLHIRVPLAADGAWRVTTVVPVSQSIAEILQNLESSSGQWYGELFALRSSEPLSTFHSLWSNNRSDALKFAAFLLAWVWRAEELRNA